MIVLTLELGAILALVLVNGLLAAVEIAVVSVRLGRVRHLADGGDPRGAALWTLRAEPDRFFATVQIGITLVGALAAALGGATLVGAVAPRLVAAAPALAGVAEPLALALVVGGITFTTLVLGELVPKSLALRHAEAVALRAARPILTISRLLGPLVGLLTAASNLALRPFGDRTSFAESRSSEAEIRLLAKEGEAQGAIERRERQLLERVFHFGDAKVRDVWVPRHELVALDLTWPPEEVRRVVLGKRHGRLPVYDGSLDRPLGYVTLRDILERVWSGQPVDLGALIHEAYRARPEERVTDVLQELQRRRQHLALIVGAAGRLEGIVTVEDLVEELVGEIWGEHDARPAQRP